MRGSFTSRCLSCKRNLVLVGGLLSLSAFAQGQVNEWESLSNVWDEGQNWTLGLPVQNQVQRIETNLGIGNTIYLRNSATPGSVSAGTIEFDNVENYENFYAGTLSASTMNFGTFSGGFFNSSSIMFVGEAPSGIQRMTWQGSGALNVFGKPGSKIFAFSPIVEGTGSLTFGKIGPGSGKVQIDVGRIRPFGSGSFSDGYLVDTKSTYTGGSIIEPDTIVLVPTSSQFGASPSGFGPLGLATVTLAGGTLVLAGRNESTVLENHIRLTDHSVIAAASGSSSSATPTRTLSGPINLNGNRLTLELNLQNNAEFIFDNTTFSSSDAGTIAIASRLFDTNLVHFNVSGSTSNTFGGAIGELGGSEETSGVVVKTGAGTLGALHFRVKSLDIAAGTLRVLQD